MTRLASMVAGLMLGSALMASSASAEDVINLRLTALTGASGKGTQAAIEVWNKANPGIQVSVEIQADEVNWQQTAPTTMFASSDGPDLSWWWCAPSMQYKDMIAAGQLAPLDDIFEKAAYPQGTINYFTEPDGHVYGINNAAVWTPWVYYNKDVFDKLGLATPKTWDELYAVSAKVREAGYQPMVTLYDFGMVSHLIQGLLLRAWTEEEYNALQVNWSSSASDAAKAVKWTDPHGVALFAKLKEIVEKGFASDGFTGLTDSEVAKSLFVSQKAAMYQSGSWDVSGLKEASKFNVGYFYYPPGDNPSYGPVASWIADCFVAFNNRPNLEAAKKVIEYLTSAEGAFIYAKASGLMPGRSDIAESDLATIADPMLISMVGDVKSQGAPALIEATIPPELMTALKHSADLIYTGQATPDEAAQLLQDAWEKARTEH